MDSINIMTQIALIHFLSQKIFIHKHNNTNHLSRKKNELQKLNMIS